MGSGLWRHHFVWMSRVFCEARKRPSPTHMKFQSCQTARERFPWSTLWLAKPQTTLSRERGSLGWVSIRGDLGLGPSSPCHWLRWWGESVPPLHDVCKETCGERIQSPLQATGSSAALAVTEAGHVPQLLPGGVQVCTAAGGCEAHSQSSRSRWKIEPSAAAAQAAQAGRWEEETERPVSNGASVPARCAGCAAVARQLGSEGHRWLSGPGSACSRLAPNPS